jgi:hypothetical protein
MYRLIVQSAVHKVRTREQASLFSVKPEFNENSYIRLIFKIKFGLNSVKLYDNYWIVHNAWLIALFKNFLDHFVLLTM